MVSLLFSTEVLFNLPLYPDMLVAHQGYICRNIAQIGFRREFHLRGFACQKAR